MASVAMDPDPYLTVYDLAKEIPLPDLNNPRAGRVPGPSLVNGLRVQPVERPEPDTVRLLSKVEVLGLRVALLSQQGDLRGYQRDPRAALTRCRRMARAQAASVPMPSAELAIVEDGSLEIVDGLKRAISALMAPGALYRASLRSLTEGERLLLFSGQTEAEPLKRDHTVMTARGTIPEYVQRAFSTQESVWKGMITRHNQGGLLSPAGLEEVVAIYGVGSLSGVKSILRSVDLGASFDAVRADELASILRVFGSYETNRLACSKRGRIALTKAAVHILRRGEPLPRNLARWESWMPRFRFGDYEHLNGKALVDQLIRHWNKKLSEAHKIPLGE